MAEQPVGKWVVWFVFGEIQEREDDESEDRKRTKEDHRNYKFIYVVRHGFY